MKFACDSCRAQYMISDEKVGANGVKVRCKKCGHIIVVKHVDEPVEAKTVLNKPPSESQEQNPRAGGTERLEDEIGQAFDSMFQGKGSDTESGGGSNPDDGGDDYDRQSTRVFSQEDLAKLAAESADSSETGISVLKNGNGHGHQAESLDLGAADWYVAINDEQVGPISAEQIKEKWDAGEVGPDTLVWRAGMDDWTPLSGINEIAHLLAPTPKPKIKLRINTTESQPKAEPWRGGLVGGGGGGGGSASVEAGGGMAMAPAPSEPAMAMSPPVSEGGFGEEEPSFRPSAASALQALASEEFQALGKPSVRSPGVASPRNGEPAVPDSSLLDSLKLPDVAGVDATGLHPLPIRALEVTGEIALPKRARESRDNTEVRLRKSTRRTVFAVAGVMVLLFIATVAAIFYIIDKKMGPTPVERSERVATRSTPAQPEPKAEPREAKPEPKAEPKEAKAAAPAPAPAPAPVRHDPSAAPQHKRVASAEPKVEARPEPKPKPSKTDDLLSVGGSSDIEKEFENELSKGDNPQPKVAAKKQSRSVYVPPAPGADQPKEVSASQINETVAGKIPALKSCLAQQKAADPDTHGTLKMRWTILGDGGVKDVQCLSPDFVSAPIAKCIAGIVKGMKFPRTQTSGQEVNFPFNF